MKKLIFLTIIMVGLTVSFTSLKKPEKEKVVGKVWWNYNGGWAEQFDPSYYSRDADNFPDCPPANGILYCCILANSNAFDNDIPDLSTIASYRVFPAN